MMFYIFNEQDVCIGLCDAPPNEIDLQTRKEYCRYSDTKICIGDTFKDGDVIKQQIKQPTPAEYEQQARKVRDAIRSQIDIYVLPTSTINDGLVTEEQKDILVQDSLTLAKWPSIDGWPFIDLPELSSLTKSIIQIPVWDYPVNTEIKVEVVI